MNNIEMKKYYLTIFDVPSFKNLITAKDFGILYMETYMKL